MLQPPDMPRRVEASVGADSELLQQKTKRRAHDHDHATLPSLVEVSSGCRHKCPLQVLSPVVGNATLASLFLDGGDHAFREEGLALLPLLGVLAHTKIVRESG